MKTPIRLKKATPAQVEEYAKTGPTYPLGYTATMYDKQGNPHTVNIEDLRGAWSRPDPVWEIMVPVGYVAGDCHSLLCYDLDDVRDRLTETMYVCDCADCFEHRVKQ